LAGERGIDRLASKSLNSGDKHILLSQVNGIANDKKQDQARPGESARKGGLKVVGDSQKVKNEPTSTAGKRQQVKPEN
jgi:hypothetical protein